MAAPPNVELEAAKFLHKLIQESKDEPRKLATKLYVILQHMRSSGKENSMPYQVISRAMESVINEHGLDIDALKSSRAPTGGTHMCDSSSTQFAGSSQTAAANDSKSGLAENERANPHASSRPPVGPNGAGHDIYQGSVSHAISKSLDHENPSSYDTKSANSQSQERHDPALDKSNQGDSKKASNKRKRPASSSTTEPHIENSQQLDNCNLNARKGNLVNKVETPRRLPLRGTEHSHFNMVQSSDQMEHIPSLPNSMKSTNLANSMQRAANPKYREEIEVSSAHSALQQGGSRLSPHYSLNSKGLWNQNSIGSSLENSQVPKFMSNDVSGNSTADIFTHQSTASLGSGTAGMSVASGHGAAPGVSASFPPVEPGISSPMHFHSASREPFCATSSAEPSAGKTAVDSEYWKHGFTKGAVANNSERTGEAHLFLANRQNLVSSSLSTESGIPSSNIEMSILRGATARDTGKSPIFQSSGVSNMPFKEQHLKQLRAQCLVFLAFRNRVMPKKLHLEIALGNFSPKEDGPSKELIDHKEKELCINGQISIPQGTMLFERPNDVRESEIVRQGITSTASLHEENSLRESKETNTIQEIAESQTFLLMGSQPDSLNVRTSTVCNDKDHVDKGQGGTTNQAFSGLGVSEQMKPEMFSHGSVTERQDIAPIPYQVPADCNIQRNENANVHLTSFPLSNERKPISGREFEHHTKVPLKDANVLAKNVSDGLKYVSEDDYTSSEIQRGSVLDGFKTVDMRKNDSPTLVKTEQVEQHISLYPDVPPVPKYTTSEKWIMEQQKRKQVIEQNWELKQKKTEQRITACSDKLKENVSSSEDISAKTKSVIELKKLQLLELQRRLRSDILNDFFKPISSDMERLKLVKKTRIGRRSKQIEKFEQRMKEERQKRIRERQKEFFSETELHKERLDDVFKMKRERWKGFNKYAREFHKRKERIHREKIDRIQREKINLLKINDVEGYLRMVQDAKSDRVRQLLKETEKYLQKLGSKLRDSKAMARHFETDVEENRAASVVENTEFDVENEDEADQAKHYLESNEKYYLMAHSIKESIMEQPTCLEGGKLRGYQMNGLRWLVSLYNNHLNGILADEMGLGKTVQVISLICYLMETKNDRGPFLVVVPSSVLPGWESEINFWAPSINRIIYSGSPEERRRLFKERIVQQKFNVLLTTYEYLMNKHDRPKLSKLHWHYIIIDEGHRIKNASCKLNADLKLYQSSHRLLLTGTPLQNNLEELWALLNFLLPNIFNSSEDFSQWFNKPFESNGDNSADQALLSEEENLLIINRLHQVLRPFVLRRLKHKVENELPEKIERLVRCEASAYQKLLMKRVEDNLGAIGTSKARSVHNSVMELRNICNHPYLSQLHVEEVCEFVPKHYLPNIVRFCGKLEMLDRLLPKLKATDHRVLFFSTMTRLLDVMEDYLALYMYRYLRLDGHTSGGDRGALIDQFNKPGSPFFIFLLSIRAGGVGVNLQAADTVIIFDTDWNPQVDLQAQARAHRIGQKKDVLVLRLETVQTVEEQVRAAAEHKLGVANQSITAGFFDNNTSAEDRREYLESLLRESKKEEAAPVLDDDSLNDLIARSESEIEIFEAIDRRRREEETRTWKNMFISHCKKDLPLPPLPPRILTEDELKPFYEAIKAYEASNAKMASNVGENMGAKRNSEGLGGLDTQHYGRGKRAREVRSYEEEQWTEEEFEKMCQAEFPESPKPKEEVIERNSTVVSSGSILFAAKTEVPAPLPVVPPQTLTELPSIQQIKGMTPPSKRGRGRPKKVKPEIYSPEVVLPSLTRPVSIFPAAPVTNPLPNSATVQSATGTIPQLGIWIAPSSESNPPLPSVFPRVQSISTPPFAPLQVKGQNQNTRREKNQDLLPPSGTGNTETIFQREPVSNFPTVSCPDSASSSSTAKNLSNEQGSVSPSVLPASTDTVETKSGSDVQPVLHAIPVLIESTQTVRTGVVSEIQPISSNSIAPAPVPALALALAPAPVSFSATSIVSAVARNMPHFAMGIGPSSEPNPQSTSVAIGSQSINPSVPVSKQPKGRGRNPQSGVEAPLRRGRRRGPVEDPNLNEPPQNQPQLSSGRKSIGTRRRRGNEALEPTNVKTEETKRPLPTSGNAAVLSDKTDSQKIDLKAQEMKVSLSDESGVSDSKLAGTKRLEAIPVVSVMETSGAVVDPAVSKPVVRELATKIDVGLCESGEGSREQRMEDSALDNLVVSETVEIKNSEEGKNSALSMLETTAPVVDPVTEKTQKKVDAEVQKINAGSFDNEDNPRDLVTEKLIVGIIVEGTTAVPLNADQLDAVPCEGSFAPNTSVLETEFPVSSVLDTCVDQSGKEDTRVQDMICPVRDDAVVSEPEKRESSEEKQFSTLSRLETKPPVVDTEIEKTRMEVDAKAPQSYDFTLQEAVVSKPEACEPKTKLEVVPSQNLADSRELVKEKSVVDDNGNDTSAVTLNIEPLDDVSCDEPPAPDVLVLESEASVLDFLMHCDDQSEKKDAKEHDTKDPIEDHVVVAEERMVITSSTLKKATPVDSESEMIENNFDAKAQESSGPILQVAVVSNPKASEPKTNKNTSSLENVSDPVLVKENLIVESNVEGTSNVPQSVQPLDYMPCEKPAADVARLDLIRDAGEDNGKENAEEQKLEGLLMDEAIVPEFGVHETNGLEQDGQAVDPETRHTCKIVDAEAQESNDPILLEAVVLKPEGCEPDSKLESSCSENAAYPRDVAKENSTDPLQNVAREKPPTADILAWETADLEIKLGKCEDQSRTEDMALDKGIESETAANEDRKDKGPGNGLVLEPVVIDSESLGEKPSTLEALSPVVDPPHESPETQLIADSSENVGDLEPIAEEGTDTVLDKRFVSEPVVTESQISEENTSNLEINSSVVDCPHEEAGSQLNVVSSETMEDSEQLCKEKPITGTHMEHNSL